MKKKIFTIAIFLLAIVLIFTNKYLRNDTKEKDDTIKIVTSFYPIYITTLNITDNIENVEVINLTKSQDGCLHDYYLLPEDMIALEDADVFIVNGEGMEEFLDKVIKSYPDLKIIYASEGIETIKCEHDGHEEINSHTWLSLENNIKQTTNITSGLSLVDKDNEEGYKANADKYIEALRNINAEKLQNKTIVATNETFEYLFNELGVEVKLVLEEEIGTDANTYDMAKVIEKIKTLNIDAIIVDPNQEDNYYKTIAQETNIKTITLNPATSGEGEKHEYINAMQENIKLMENL